MDINFTGCKSVGYANRVNLPTGLRQHIHNYNNNGDAFVRQDAVIGISRHFKQNALDRVAEWKDSFPRDGEEGCKALENMLNPYTKQLNEMKPKDISRFIELCFGENALESIQKGSKVNTTIKNFRNALEKGTLGNIENIIKTYK